MVKSKFRVGKVQPLAVGDSVAGAGKVQVLVTAPIGDSAPPARLRGTVEAVQGLAIPPIGERRDTGRARMTGYARLSTPPVPTYSESVTRDTVLMSSGNHVVTPS